MVKEGYIGLIKAGVVGTALLGAAIVVLYSAKQNKEKEETPGISQPYSQPATQPTTQTSQPAGKGLEKKTERD